MVPKPYPEESHEDVLRVARNRGLGVTLEQLAASFGIHVTTLSKRLRRADSDDRMKPGTTRQQNAELREARRIKLLEQEKDPPAREGAGRGRDSRHGHVPGLQARRAALLPAARSPGYLCRARGGPSRDALFDARR
ncbi:hypothetical protein [Streptomyces herbicida]|uniref:hypothetical protein n=1 Tax=Streptomyces herbicida TaxID=3065675 RepID=UPI00292DBECA|nr:hypothetical protein [Streptomyces sp. NEAU-HV9]